MLTAHLGALEFLPDEGKPFSIRDWIGKEDGAGERGSFLFLTSRGDQHASLRGLISDLARDRGQRDADARPGRRPAHLGHPRRAADAPPGAVIAARPRGIPPVRRLFRARRPGRLGAARPLREERGRDHLRSLRHPRGAGRARPRHGAMVGRQPRAQRGRGGGGRGIPTAPTPSATASR